MAEGGQDQTSGVADVMSTSLSFGTSGSAILAEGENVNLKFAKSTINIVPGDQINANKVVFNISGAEGEATPTKQVLRAERGQDQNYNAAGMPPPSSSSPVSSGFATLAEGENVYQNFIKSKVKVVAGDEIHGDKVINNYYMNAQSQANPADRKINSKKLIQICNDNTKAATNIDILDDFRHEELQKPDFEVYPQMRQVEVDDYYKGRYGHNQLTQEVGFLRQKRIEARDVKIGDLVASMWQRETTSVIRTIGVTAIVASAGSGKSTLTRRIARHALGVSATYDAEDLPTYDKKMVHYIELKDNPEISESKPSKFLFGGLYRSEEEEDLAFEWLDEHQTKSILIFDGLDQATWKFDEKNPRKIRKYDKASSWTVMYNILSRNILPRVKIYIASREFKVSELPALARPETIITMNGLSLEDAHRLFTFLLKEEGEVLWQKIETVSPRLLNLVSVPVFLILTAVVMGRDPSKPAPATVTELYNRIILSLRSVENIRNREQILSIVNKLKALAFQGMKEGRVVFKDTELDSFGVSTKEVQDLMTKVPGNNLLSRHLMQGDFTFFFCHQSIQEYLAAIFVAEMEFNEFSRFDKEHLHEERWSVVRRFVAGVVFSKSQNDLYRVSAQTDKRQVLGRSIRSQFKNAFARIRMEVYTAIYESDDDDLMKQVDEIDVDNIPLSRDEAHVIGTLTARSRGLEELALCSCEIDDEMLAVIGRCLKEPVHVKKVDLLGDKISALALRSFLGHGRIEALSGNLLWEEVWVDAARLDNKGDDVISINDGWGRFNIEGSSLSFKWAPSDLRWRVEFLDELFED